MFRVVLFRLSITLNVSDVLECKIVRFLSFFVLLVVLSRLPYAEIYLLIAIFAIGEQKSVLAKQSHMLFVTGDAKGQGCNNFGILHLKLPWSKWVMCR